MADWFKFYPHWLSDTDFLYAVDRLPETLTVWVSLLCEACDHKSGTLDAQDANRRLVGYARKTNVSIPRINEALLLLDEIGWIDRSDPLKITLRCWKDTQSTYCKRVKTPTKRPIVTKVVQTTHIVRTHDTQTDHIVSPEERRGDQSRREEIRPEEKRDFEKLSTVPGSTVIPLLLNTPEFRAAWVMWLEHLKQKRKSPSLHAQDLQLRKLATFGPEKAVQTLNHCIEHNWQGIYEQRTETDQRNHRPTPSEIRNSFITGADPSGAKAVAVVARRKMQAEALQAQCAQNGVATQVAGLGSNAP